MKKIISLRRNQDFRRIYAKGKYFPSDSMVTYVLKNRLNSLRLGITTSKKIGNAVQRNRARRIIRAAYMTLKSKLSGGLDIVFVARKKAVEIKSQDIAKDMRRQLGKLGLLG